jgi:hypothetical protein
VQKMGRNALALTILFQSRIAVWFEGEPIEQRFLGRRSPPLQALDY